MFLLARKIKAMGIKMVGAIVAWFQSSNGTMCWSDTMWCWVSNCCTAFTWLKYALSHWFIRCLVGKEQTRFLGGTYTSPLLRTPKSFLKRQGTNVGALRCMWWWQLGFFFNPSCCLPIVMELNQLDCLRANKSTQAWGLEARVPFLDTKFLNVVMVGFGCTEIQCLAGSV